MHDMLQASFSNIFTSCECKTVRQNHFERSIWRKCNVTATIESKPDSERIVKKGIVPIRAGSGWTTGASNTNQL